MSMMHPGRQRGEEFAADARARRIPVDAHVGDFRDFHGRLERAARDAACGYCRQDFLEKVFRRATDERNLRYAWRYLRSGDGHAPGVDGLHYGDVPDSVLWAHLEQIRNSLRLWEYHPQALREVPISKGPQGGTRQLQLPTINDRTVGRAIIQALQPFLDHRQSRFSFGFRPKLDRRHALATAEKLATRDDRWVWLVADIKDAFPSVPRSRLTDVVRRQVQNEDLIEVIGMLANNAKSVGIPMGQPLSPLLLNVYLDHFLDRPWRHRFPQIPLIRYADDLLILARDLEEALQAHAALGQLLSPAGMQIKRAGTPTIANLRTGDRAEWLGFSVSKDGDGIRAELTEDSWFAMEDDLRMAHTRPASPICAQEGIQGWLYQAGVTFTPQTAGRTVRRVLQIARSLGFDELPSKGEFTDMYQLAYADWGQVRTAVHSGLEIARLGERLRRTPFFFNRPAPCRGDIAPVPPGQVLTVFTDGACLSSRGNGGWAFRVDYSDEQAKPARFSRSGAETGTTANRMELTAVIMGLESLPGAAQVHLLLDSKYVADGITRWLPRWRDQDWQAGSGRRRRALKNADLWQRLAAQLDRHDVQVEWVRGHSGCDGNEFCDHLANLAATTLHVSDGSSHSRER